MTSPNTVRSNVSESVPILSAVTLQRVRTLSNIDLPSSQLIRHPFRSKSRLCFYQNEEPNLWELEMTYKSGIALPLDVDWIIPLRIFSSLLGSLSHKILFTHLPQADHAMRKRCALIKLLKTNLQPKSQTNDQQLWLEVSLSERHWAGSSVLLRRLPTLIRSRACSARDADGRCDLAQMMLLAALLPRGEDALGASVWYSSL